MWHKVHIMTVESGLTSFEEYKSSTLLCMRNTGTQISSTDGVF